jgi:hypothetical protein
MRHRCALITVRMKNFYVYYQVAYLLQELLYYNELLGYYKDYYPTTSSVHKYKMF